MDKPLLITNPTNIRYLTGFVGAAPEERESYVLLTQDTTYLFTNSLYKEAAQQLSNPTNPTDKPIVFVEISRENPIGEKLAGVLTGSDPVKKQGLTLLTIRLGFEENDVIVAEYNKLKKELRGITLVPTKNRIEELRMIKRSDEIANIKAAAKLTDQCFTFILSKLTPGVEEGDIAWEIEAFIRKNGATLAFSPIVAFGKNSSQPHYSPNFTRHRLEIEAHQGEALQTALKTQDIILLDFGARVNGYCSDMTRVVFIGKPKDEWRRAYEVVLEAQQAALEYLTGSDPVKRSGKEADRIAREVIKKTGFPPYPHGLGHGVGLDIHEAPRLTAQKAWKDAILLPGMVVTVEPAVYVEGQYGIRIEDLILLKKDGIELLSQSPKEMIVL